MKVGIVSAAQTKFGYHREYRSHELTYLAVKEALGKVGLAFREGYQAIVTCGSDHWEGQTLSDISHGEMAGAELGPSEEKVCMDGANAVFLGCLKILSGHDDVVLVTAACKEKEVLDPNVIENFGFDVPYQQLIGLDFTQAAALQATSYMHKYGLKREDFADVVVKNRKSAKSNPWAAVRKTVSREEVLNSTVLSYPIAELDRRPYCDGACAIVLASEEKAKELTDKPIWITGMGTRYDYHNLGDRDLATPTALFKAAQDAYRMAGIEDPAKEIDIFEISEHYSYQELLWLEGLGLCHGKEAAKLLSSGETSRQGNLPVNPSGGLLMGVPRYVAGANRVIEGFLQLRGEAGKRQVKKEPHRALAHGSYGPAGQYHCVIIMEREH